ncbi:MAG: hypothetical protein AAFU73_10020 [Planctomycetota bacterium]
MAPTQTPMDEQPPPLPRERFEAAASPRAEADLDCDNCGAPLAWSPEKGALACGHCGASHEIDVREGTIVERPLEDSRSAPRGFGRSVRVLECETCDARVTFDEASTSAQCPFCGSAAVLSQEANRNQIRPESLVPLEVGRARVEENFRVWARKKWFRPSALKHASTETAVGVYVPAWTFDAWVDSEWSAQSGTYYWVTETYTVRVGNRTEMRTRRVRKVRWWPSWGSRRDQYDDVVVIASTGVDAGLAEKLGGYRAEGLVPYAPEFLAGWRAEEYRIDVDEGWRVARLRIEASQRRRCAGDVPGDTHRALRVKNELSDVRWKHVLFPMWSVTYRLGERSYAVLVHGQTGRVVGHAPVSWWKILFAVLLVAAFVGTIAVAAQAR